MFNYILTLTKLIIPNLKYITVDVEHSHVRFLGNLVLNLWDCGGQEAFMENYFASQRDNIFRNVEVLIYVFDVESRELDKDMHYYQSCLEAILQVLFYTSSTYNDFILLPHTLFFF